MRGDLLSTPPLLSTNRTAAIVALFHSPNLSPIIVLAFKIYWHVTFFSVSMKLRLTYASAGLPKCQNWRNISAQWMEHDPPLSMLIHLGEALSASWEETFSQFFSTRDLRLAEPPAPPKLGLSENLDENSVENRAPAWKLRRKKAFYGLGLSTAPLIGRTRNAEMRPSLSPLFSSSSFYFSSSSFSFSSSSFSFSSSSSSGLRVNRGPMPQNNSLYLLFLSHFLLEELFSGNLPL